MIKGYCRTNLDEYENEKWPITFVAVPNKGDRVEAASGVRLKVGGITHCQRLTDDEPCIEVELNK